MLWGKFTKGTGRRLGLIILIVISASPVLPASRWPHGATRRHLARHARRACVRLGLRALTISLSGSGSGGGVLKIPSRKVPKISISHRSIENPPATLHAALYIVIDNLFFPAALRAALYIVIDTLKLPRRHFAPPYILS
jgi:hypothetical protein